METIEQINKRITERYGLAVDDGKPKFRLVWSDSQLETRIGHFGIYSGDVWLRDEYGAHLAPKYSHIKSRWLLEIHYRGVMPKEILSSDPYEILWTFDENQMPLFKAVELIIYSWENQLHIPKISQQEAFDKEVAENLIKIQNISPMIPTLMQHGSAVFLDSTKQEKLNVRSDDSQSGADSN